MGGPQITELEEERICELYGSRGFSIKQVCQITSRSSHAIYDVLKKHKVPCQRRRQLLPKALHSELWQLDNVVFMLAPHLDEETLFIGKTTRRLGLLLKHIRGALLREEEGYAEVYEYWHPHKNDYKDPLEMFSITILSWADTTEALQKSFHYFFTTFNGTHGLTVIGLGDQSDCSKRMDQEKQAVINSYSKGRTIKEIASHYGCSTVHVSRRLKEWGVDVRGKPNYDDAYKAKALSMYGSGVSASETARELGIAKQTLYNWLSVMP